MIKNVAVIGGGTMGHGIAETFAIHGLKVNVFELNSEIRDHLLEVIETELNFMAEHDVVKKSEISSILGRISVSDDLQRTVADADYVIEAVPEIIELKQKLFKELDEYCKPEAIFASNTSSLALQDMMRDVSEERKKRMMVCHWYNPAHLMPIAELSFFGNMPLEIYKEVETLYTHSGKQVVKVLKDVPGLVANRIQQAIAREVFSLMEMGVAEPEDIDKALKFGPAFRYATAGQLEIADMGGLDIWCTVGDNLLKVMDNSMGANPILREKVNSGDLGIKTGKGFFEYPQDQVSEKKEAFNKRLITQLKIISNYI